MSEVKRFSLVKPTDQTPFHIDFSWWQSNESDWHVHLRSLLCETHQEMFANWQNDQLIDWVDPETAEVRPMDGLQHMLLSHCSHQPGFITDHTALVDGVFRVLLANGNAPMNSQQLAQHLGKSADTILRTISGPRVYKGIRPVQG
jgi:hypothetical protein